MVPGTFFRFIATSLKGHGFAWESLESAPVGVIDHEEAVLTGTFVGSFVLVGISNFETFEDLYSIGEHQEIFTKNYQIGKETIRKLVQWHTPFIFWRMVNKVSGCIGDG